MRKNNKIDRLRLHEIYNSGIMDPKQIAEIMGNKRSSICSAMRSLGLKVERRIKRDLIRYDFFEKIDSEEKAYCLGLWYSDGCVNWNSKQSKYRILINMCDRDIIEKVAKCLNYPYKIQLVKKGPNRKDQYRIEISSTQLGVDLINNGCVTNKSLNLNFPNYDIVPKNLIRHFIRGVFDGDGTISKGLNDKWMIGFYGTREVIDGIYKEFGFNFSIHKDKRKNNCWRGYITKKICKLYFLKWLYQDSTIYMNRKFEKSMQCIGELQREIS